MAQGEQPTWERNDLENRWRDGEALWKGAWAGLKGPNIIQGSKNEMGFSSQHTPAGERPLSIACWEVNWHRSYLVWPQPGICRQGEINHTTTML